MQPLISVILPVHNGEKYLKEAVNSILNQTLVDFELIIINDGSTDNTYNILRSFNDGRVKIINNAEKLRVVRCLNLGIQMAKGKYIARMDADDISVLTRFEKQVEYFDAHPAIDICGSYVDVFGNKEFVLRTYEDHDDIKAALLFLNVVTHPSVMFKSASFKSRSLLYDEAFVNAEDYGLWIDAMDTMKFATVPMVLLNYRLHDENISIKKLTNWDVLKEMNFKAYRKIFKRMGLNPTQNELNMHINAGFKITENLPEFEFRDYVIWLQKIVLNNNTSQYFDNDSLRNQIIHKMIYLARNMEIGTADLFFLFKVMFNIFGTANILKFFRYRSVYLKILNN
ncbi:glycosyltransferase family 2 protein [Mucilaginibacter ginkgonis]|uniref:Glycosyltransferase family 2 protein n=1 Tax=Mucilaginibacter ginkgonis TaxID=2682091 RepID=A0A6I4IMJ5_9SPHI|nr:glycosyltransferase [Mucilaginibacter ginkgonis]QQL50204.1 glycosyltransferase family 2 protein [Mucilaginibacter ginkgonis]